MTPRGTEPLGSAERPGATGPGAVPLVALAFVLRPATRLGRDAEGLAS